MASVKNLSRTAKIIIAVVVCVVIVGAGVGGAFYNQWKDLPEVVVASAELGSVSQHYSTTAQVQSREKTIYEALDGVVVNSVEVQVGDVVNEGTVLATFDTSALGDTLESKRKSYQRAKTAYDDAVDAAAEAEENLPKIEQQIAELEQKIEADRTSTTTTTAPAATAPATTVASSNTSSGGVLDSIINSIIGGSGTSTILHPRVRWWLKNRAPHRRAPHSRSRCCSGGDDPALRSSASVSEVPDTPSSAAYSCPPRSPSYCP